MESCKLAGLRWEGIIEEPVAAALYHAYKDHDLSYNKASLNHIFLVFDCGGGRTDISIVKIRNGKFILLASNGDYSLGGQDLDIVTMRYLINEYE